jgi:hypothetical protein
MPGQSGEGRKRFFFEKRRCPPDGLSGLSPSGKAKAKTGRSFLLLFFKKEGLA